MKRYCILEQGSSINDPITIKKKKIFNTEYSDIYRLNWNQDNDPNAFIIKKNITWSEGRSILYEKVPKSYEYYIIIDDDIEFFCEDNDLPKKIDKLLSEYRPLTGTFMDFNKWHITGTSIKKEDYLDRKCFPISGYDLQVQIYSKSYADIIFPVIYHGSGRSMWYSQWVCHKIYPLKQICFNEIMVTNKRHENHLYKDLPQYISGEKALWLFNKDVKEKKVAVRNKNDINKNNERIFNNQVDKNKVEFCMDDLAKVYNIENYYFKNRTAICENRKGWRYWWDSLLWEINNKPKEIKKKLKNLINKFYI